MNAETFINLNHTKWIQHVYMSQLQGLHLELLSLVGISREYIKNNSRPFSSSLQH